MKQKYDKFSSNRKHCQKVRTTYKLRKNKYMIVEWKNCPKQNKIGQLTIKNYTFERVENIIADKTLTYVSETWILTKTDRQQINIFERKV
jgi:hypothetical protein